MVPARFKLYRPPEREREELSLLHAACMTRNGSRVVLKVYA